MGKLIKIQNVPDRVHRKLKARATRSGSSLSAYLRRELALIAARPIRDEVVMRLQRRAPIGALGARERPAAIIRRHRDAE